MSSLHETAVRLGTNMDDKSIPIHIKTTLDKHVTGLLEECQRQKRSKIIYMNFILDYPEDQGQYRFKCVMGMAYDDLMDDFPRTTRLQDLCFYMDNNKNLEKVYNYLKHEFEGTQFIVTYSCDDEQQYLKLSMKSF